MPRYCFTESAGFCFGSARVVITDLINTIELGRIERLLHK
jgi:hypothetical protein